MKKYKLILIASAGVFVVAGLILAAVLIAFDGKEKNNSNAQTSTEASLKNFISEGKWNYKQFSLKYPEDWAVQVDDNEPTQPIYTFSKGEYKLVISQVDGDGAECVFNSDFDPEMADFYIDISKYKYETIGSEIGKFYYYPVESDSANHRYEFCGPSQDQPNKYYKLGDLGIVSLDVPANTDPTTMLQMAGIISSVTIVGKY